MAFEHRKHVVNVTVEADAFCGPLLALKAAQAGVVYSLAFGDQPALICDLVDWARTCGFPVVAAGRGHKWLPHFCESTPDTVWPNYGLTPEQAARGGLNPKMFNSFLDGSKPSIESTAVAPGDGSQGMIGSRTTYTLLGVDWVALQNLAQARKFGLSKIDSARDQPSLPPTGSSDEPRPGDPSANESALWARLQDSHSALVPAAVAAGLSSPILPLVIQEQILELKVAGVIPEDPSQPKAPDNLLLLDLPALQRLTGRTGQLDRIEFVLPEGADRPARAAALRKDLSDWMAGRWILSSSSDRRDNAATMTQAFRLNLTILSLLALLVGLMLVYQALDGAVVRRREEIAILRSVGLEAERSRRAW